MSPEIANRHDEIEREQHDRDRNGNDDGDMPFRRPGVAEHDRRKRDEDGRAAESQLSEERAPVDRGVLRPDELRDAQHEQQVRDHGTGE